MDNQVSHRTSGAGPQRSGQGLTEFALILPVLLLLILGIIEFGRLMVAISSVSTASRDAARYAVSIGESPAGIPFYQDCLGIRQAAQKIALFVDATVVIRYDADGPGAAAPVEYCQVGKTTDPVQVTLGGTISVSVSDVFEPLVPIVKLPPIPVSSQTARTVLRDVYVK